MSHESLAVDAGTGAGQVFYRYIGPEGRPVITNTLGAIPPNARSTANVIVINPEPPSLRSKIDSASLAVGAGLGIIAGIGISSLARAAPRASGYAAVAALLLVGFLAYFGWTRRTAGLDEAAVATPQALIEDAEKAVQKMNAKLRQQDEQIQEIQDESKK